MPGKYKLEKKQLPRFLETLMGIIEVIAPVHTLAGHVFKQLSHPYQADLSYGNTAYSSKKMFLPTAQAMLEYSLENAPNFTPIETSAKKRILFGCRQCELHAINQNDSFFLDKPADSQYKKLRENTLIAVLQCKKAATEHCFCTSLGFDSVPKNFDLLLEDEGEFYAVSAGSKEGENLIALGQLAKYEGATKAPGIKCQTCLAKGAANILEKKEAYGDPIWEATARICISCGACTIACPTCWCFDTDDQNEIGLKKTVRMRKWDSCQFLEFGRVGGDFCFRRNRQARVKHRVYHKFPYSMERFGYPTCVGCGRCLPICLTKINHVEILNKLNEKYSNK